MRARNGNKANAKTTENAGEKTGQIAGKNPKTKARAMAVKGGGMFFLNLFIVVSIAICLLHALNNFAVAVQRYERLDALAAEHNSVRIQNDAIRDRLEKSRAADREDEEFIISVARSHGLRKDSDIIFYLYAEE